MKWLSSFFFPLRALLLHMDHGFGTASMEADRFWMSVRMFTTAKINMDLCCIVWNGWKDQPLRDGP
ncbi:MAG: hypothetical protein CL912_21060 [Deltaproteobacteria bacterium]|nr:hypothetical protein [Deltaproteobacteria bacterium]